MPRAWTTGTIVAALLLAACSTTPAVTHASTTMTPQQIADLGLECRQDKPIDTNVPRTICATPESWAQFDERRRQETAALLARARDYSTFGRFNRDGP